MKELSETFSPYIINFYEDMKNKESHRYKSWEYCYKFFYDNIDELKNKEHIVVDLAALHLAFYLASWGMYRGSSFLLQKDYTVHKKAVEIIADYFDLCKINIGEWNEDNTNNLFNLKDKLNEHYKEIRDNVKNQNDIQKTNKTDISDTLITKILLGTLGITPAYDSYLKKGLGLYNDVFMNNEKHIHIPATFSTDNFNKLIEFCRQHKEILKDINLSLTIDKNIQYPLMKKIDMYFWNLGRPWAIKDGDNWKVSDKIVEENNQYINYLDEEKAPNCFEIYKLKEVK